MKRTPSYGIDRDAPHCCWDSRVSALFANSTRNEKRGFECSFVRRWFVKGSLHGKGVVTRQASGALSWEMNEQINLPGIKYCDLNFLTTYMAVFIWKMWVTYDFSAAMYSPRSVLPAVPVGRWWKAQGRGARAASRPSLRRNANRWNQNFHATRALRSFTATNFLLRGRSAPHSKLCSESFFICHFLLSAEWKLWFFVYEP